MKKKILIEIEERTKRNLKRRAAENGRAMCREAEKIIEEAVSK